MKKITTFLLFNNLLLLLKKLPTANKAGFCLLVLGFIMIDPGHSYATGSSSYSSGSSYGSSTVYAVGSANTPVGPATYCSGGTAGSYTCSDNETSCSSPFANTNTITYQWYVDAAVPASGSSATGTYNASGFSNTVTLSAADAATTFNTLAAGAHTLYCTFTPNVANCYYAAYTAVTSPTLAITITASTVGPIIGPSSICPGATVNFSDATSGGVWSSDNTPVVTISTSGAATGSSGGTANISYTIGACGAGLAVTVGSLPPITGPTPLIVCVGSTITLSDASTGGVWSSSNPGVASVSGSGAVLGVANGTATITYTVGACSVTALVTVGVGAITGTPATCPGGTSQLSDATAGGVWSSSNMTTATVSTTGLVTGSVAGTTNISYTVGSCAVGMLFTVSPLPAITGPTPANVCVGTTITLRDTAPGGVWSSGSATVATVTSAGVVTGVVSGSASIIYSIWSCSVNLLVSVGTALPAISGTTTICNGSSTHLSDNTPGGVWSSTTPSVAAVGSGSGIVTGSAAGTANISYTLGACSVGTAVTVDPPNGGVITGKDSVCPGPGHVITLSDAETGGIWSSSSTSFATIDPATGVVTGVRTGTTTIRYVVTNACGTYTVLYVVHIRTTTQCATGINEPAAETATELKISPNPNGGTFTMNLLSDLDEEVHVVITNIAGAKVREFTTTTNKVVGIKLEPASAGIYLLSATTAHGKYVAKVEVN